MKGACERCKSIIDEVEYCQNDGLCYSCYEDIDALRVEAFNNRYYGGWNKK